MSKPVLVRVGNDDPGLFLSIIRSSSGIISLYFGWFEIQANDGGLIQNLVRMTTTRLLRDDFEIMLPINQVNLSRLFASVVL